MKNNYSVLEAKTRRQIAAEYGISPRTLNRLLKKNNIILPSGLVFPKDQLIIYQKLGLTQVEMK